MILQQITSEDKKRRRQQSDSSRSRSRQKTTQQQKEEQFQNNQELIRSLLRIEQGRQQPVDKFVKIIMIYKAKTKFQKKMVDLMENPKIFLKKMTSGNLEEVLQSIKKLMKVQEKNNTKFVEYWSSLKNLIKTTQSIKKETANISQILLEKIEQTINKPLEQLLMLEQAIDSTIKNSSFSTDESFWRVIKLRINEKKYESSFSSFYKQFKEHYQENQKEEDQQNEEEYDEPFSPILGPYSIVNPKYITTEQSEKIQRNQIAKKIFKDQFEKCKQKLQQNLSLPKNHNLLTNTNIVSESTHAYDYISKQIIEFEKYKRLQEDQQEFDDWVPCETEGRFRDRKPEYINRVRVLTDWNKFNNTHYTQENPPPKAIQGYKFSIFYPDLFDKLKTPQYFLETTESPDFCIIKFKAGPPYKDVAFKIQRRQWDFSEKSGFESIFLRGILQLYFNFKKPKFRI